MNEFILIPGALRKVFHLFQTFPISLPLIRYLTHLQGWKVRKDSRVDPSDKSLDKSLRTIVQDKVEKYDTQPVRIALFGLGRIGMIHLQKIYSNPRTKLVYCVEPVPERRQYVRTAWFLNDVTFVDISEADKVINDPGIDAVVIGTPTYTHKELTIRSLKAKKAVLCEKPLAPDFDGTKECYELADKMGVPLLTAFNRRFDPGYFDCRTRARAGEVGKIRVIKTCARDSPLPPIEYLRTSGGIYKDCAVHDIDLLLWITGELPTQVFSQAHVYDDKIKAINDFDTVSIVMKFPSGTLGMIDLSRNSCYGYDQRLEVFGVDGMLTSGNIRPNGVITETTKGTNKTPYYYSFASRYGEAYAIELDHFVDVFKGKLFSWIPKHSLH